MHCRITNVLYEFKFKRNKLDLLTRILIVLLRWKFQERELSTDVDELSGGCNRKTIRVSVKVVCASENSHRRRVTSFI